MPDTCPPSAAVPVSIIQLIATPERYDGKTVRVEGFLHYKFEDSELYLSKDDADHLNGKNGVWVSYTTTERLCLQPDKDWSNRKQRTLSYFDEKWVLLEGTFDMKGHGHMGAASGTLADTYRVLESRRWYK